MKTATTIIKNKVLPQLGKDPQFDSKKLNDAFWEKVAYDFLNYETDPKPLYAAIYCLGLEDTEKVITKLPGYYTSILKELAEAYVLGETSETTKYLLKNESFIKEVQFFKTLQQAIKSVERSRIKSDLPTMADRLNFELSETDIENAAKKKGREDLKAKMKLWDAEVEEEKPVLDQSSSDKETSKSKVISLSWIKYAVAASIIITAGVFYFNSTSLKKENTIVKTNGILEIETETLTAIITDSITSPVLKKISFGFTPDTEKITVVFNNLQPRVLSINKAVFNYQKQLDTLLVAKKTDSIAITNELNKRISALKEELQSLKEKENQYVFDGKVLNLFNPTSKENQIILFKDHYYLQKDDQFFKLLISKEPQQFRIETDSNVLEALERIIFDND
ncbi:MAG: hypothetical protein WC389_13785 [Lutibacter sp.]|jgi:hypothetical protein